jgi:hypothetical protein
MPPISQFLGVQGAVDDADNRGLKPRSAKCFTNLASTRSKKPSTVRPLIGGICLRIIGAALLLEQIEPRIWPIFGLLARNGAVFGIGGFEPRIWTYFRTRP